MGDQPGTGTIDVDLEEEFTEDEGPRAAPRQHSDPVLVTLELDVIAPAKLLSAQFVHELTMPLPGEGTREYGTASGPRGSAAYTMATASQAVANALEEDVQEQVVRVRARAEREREEAKAASALLCALELSHFLPFSVIPLPYFSNLQVEQSL